MPNLTKEELLLILDALRHRYGPGYAEDKKVAALQAKLSVMLEVAARREER